MSYNGCTGKLPVTEKYADRAVIVPALGILKAVFIPFKLLESIVIVSLIPSPTSLPDSEALNYSDS